MADDPKKTEAEEEKDESEESEESEKESSEEKDESRSEAKSASDEESEEEEEEEQEEEKPAAKKAAEAPKPRPTGPIIIGPKEGAAPKHVEVEPKKRPALLLAEYSSPGKCLHAAEKLRDAGYKKFDAHTPFPVHGMDAAMGLPDSRLGWIVLCGGLTGVTSAVLMIWWMNGVDYPIIIGGKPGFTLPASVPIMFELTVLLSAFSAVFGMLHLNRLPRHHHPIFESDRFRGATDDKFFVSVEVEDPKFDLKKTRTLLEGTHADNIELVEEVLEPEAAKEEEH